MSEGCPAGMIDCAFSPESKIQTGDSLIAEPVEIGANGRAPVDLVEPRLPDGA